MRRASWARWWCIAAGALLAPACGDGGVAPGDAGGRDVAPPPPTDMGTLGRCEQVATCDLCTSGSACGWCRNVGRCLAGGFDGPTSGACTTAQWAWTTDDCHAARLDGGGTTDTGTMDTGPTPRDTGAAPDADLACRGATSCAACTAMPTCGWCRTAGRCRAGTSTGPNDGSCATADWAWLSGMCGG